MKALLDTHILLWWLEGAGRLSRAQAKAIGDASDDSPLWVSEISLWEIATLVDLGRVKLRVPLRDWLEQARIRIYYPLHIKEFTPEYPGVNGSFRILSSLSVLVLHFYFAFSF